MCSGNEHLSVSAGNMRKEKSNPLIKGLVCTCGLGMLLSMVLLNFESSHSGTGAAFGIYAIAMSLGPTSVIDSIRTTLWHQSEFGSAYSLKVTMNNA